MCYNKNVIRHHIKYYKGELSMQKNNIKLDTFSFRMKKYEKINRTYFIEETPIIVKLDMCNAHKFTEGLEKPFDAVFNECMLETMLYICEHFHGVDLGYTHSDEIVLIFTNDKHCYKQCSQKLISEIASMATNRFIKNWYNYHIVCDNYILNRYNEETKTVGFNNLNIDDYKNTLAEKLNEDIMFNAVAFSIPKKEINNYFIYRQRIAKDNAVKFYARTLYPQKEIFALNSRIAEFKNKLKEEKDISYNDIPHSQKLGFCCIKDKYNNTKWRIDNYIPDFEVETNYISSNINCNTIIKDDKACSSTEENMNN